jgi:hypothetical protein
MCPSSQSWPPKLNRDTGQNSEAWFQRSSCSRPMPRRYPIKRLVRHRRRATCSPGSMTVFSCWPSSPSGELLMQ